MAFTGLILVCLAAIPYHVAWIFFRRDGVSFWSSSVVIQDNDQLTSTGKLIWRCGMVLFITGWVLLLSATAYKLMTEGFSQ